MPSAAAVKWAWLVGVDLPRLFSTKLVVEDLTFTPLPDATKEQKKKDRNKPVPPDSTGLYLAALKLSTANPFIAPRLGELVRQAGIHFKHPALKETQFIRLMNRLRNYERHFVHKERVWREVADVHSAALKVLAQSGRLTRRRVGSEMARPGSFCRPLARAYLKWFKKRIRNAKLPLGPKRVPFDVRAYWNFVAHSAATKGD